MPDPTPEPNNSNNNHVPNHERRKKTLLILGAIVLTCALLSLIYWWLFLLDKESTDDAYVGGNAITIFSRVPGAVNAYYADDTDLVQKGQKLLDLDPIDLELAFESQKAALAIAVRDIVKLKQQVQQVQATIQAQEARLEKLRFDYNNRAALIHSKAISKEDLDHARTDLIAAEADLKASQHQLEGLKAQLGTTSLEEHPQVVSASVQLRNAFVNLSRGTIYAPATGYVAQRKVQVGENVKTDRALMSVFPLEQIWVDANFKEKELYDIRIGQKAKVKADIYGSSVIYRGKVVGIAPGSGSVFSLLPPQNATGNWIKIVQRVPVRIALEPEQVKQYPLRVGLSVYVTVDTSDQSGLPLATLPTEKKLASTNIFDTSFEEVNALIADIIAWNRREPYAP